MQHPTHAFDATAPDTVRDTTQDDKEAEAINDTLSDFEHPQLADDDYTHDILAGAVIYGPDDSKIGTVSEVHGSGRSAHAVVDVGGFLGIGAKPVAIPLADISFVRDQFGAVNAITGWTRDQVKAFPEHLPHR